MIEITLDESCPNRWRIRMARKTRLRLIAGLERHGDTRYLGSALRNTTSGELFAGRLTTATIRAQAKLSGIAVGGGR